MIDLSARRMLVDAQTFAAEDHFIAGGVASGSIGSLGWIETNSAAGTNTKQAGAVNRPGVLRLVTGATSGNNKRLHLGASASEASFDPALFDRFRFVVAVPTITTVLIRVGLMQDISAASGGTAGAYFEFDPTLSANWRTVTRQASASTANASSIAVTAGNWYLLEARREDSGSWVFAINAVDRVTHSANQPTTACAFGALCQTVTAAARNLDIDYVYARSQLGQRFT